MIYEFSLGFASGFAVAWFKKRPVPVKDVETQVEYQMTVPVPVPGRRMKPQGIPKLANFWL